MSQAPERDEGAIRGTVHQEVFRDRDGAFAVLRLETPDGLVTVAGPLPLAHPGETLEAQGGWVIDARHGRQFRARAARVEPPSGKEALERYLGSGAVEGIGPELSRRIVARFGEDAVRILDEEPARLREVKGIGKKKLEKVTTSWEKQRAGREAMLFLRGHDVGPVLAERIAAKYGADTRRILDEDPYALARDIDGVGFLTADRLARGLGLATDDPRRLRAGLLHVATEALADGHTAVPADALLRQAGRWLRASDPPALERALLVARQAGDLELDRPPGPPAAPGALAAFSRGRDDDRDEAPPDEPADAVIVPTADVPDVLYLPQTLRAERGAAQRTAELVRAGHAKKKPPPTELDRALEALARERGLALTADQARAVRACLTSPLVVITGGPGVGKTTILRALVEVLRARETRFALAAPTGRAAKRLEEATGAPASTLHRLLEFDPREGGFQRGERQPLEVDLLVVDEASMVDVRLYHALVRALPPGATLVLTGDKDQLPSVGPGAVLQDLIASGLCEVVRLTEVFRQAAQSRIVAAAHAINRGEVPSLDADPAGPDVDFFFVERKDALATRDAIVKLVTERIPRRFGLDPVDDVQVLAPMRRGACGTDALNRTLKAVLAGRPVPSDEEARAGPPLLEQGDKVMQLRNDYDNDVFNGDVGRVTARDPDGGLVVTFDGREVRYARPDTHRLALAHCATIHKAQGSEYPAVVVPLLGEHFVMLERNLLYTAITRARKLVVIVGQRRAIEMAVQNDRPRQRLTFLAARLAAAMR